MSVGAAHAAVFYGEVLRSGEVWTIRSDVGVPAPIGTDGRRAMPFSSIQSRAEVVINTVPAYPSFSAHLIELAEWRARWLPGLRSDDVLVGLNWSGEQATGYDVSPEDVERAPVAEVRRLRSGGLVRAV